jgi:phosphatidate phosphatase PAH1
MITREKDIDAEPSFPIVTGSGEGATDPILVVAHADNIPTNRIVTTNLNNGVVINLPIVRRLRQFCAIMFPPVHWIFVYVHLLIQIHELLSHVE